MNRWAIGISCFLVLAVLAVCAVVAYRIDLTPEVEKRGKVVRTRNFGEGIRLAQHGLYGVDLVVIGKAHMRKMRKGPFTIGAINELVLEDVSLALPEELWKENGGSGDAPAQTTQGDGERSGPKSTLEHLGIKSGNIRLGGKLPRFSALLIRNLKVARLDGTNAVPWFAAASAKAERGGLALRSGWSVEGGVSNSWSEALLVVEPSLRILPLK